MGCSARGRCRWRTRTQAGPRDVLCSRRLQRLHEAGQLVRLRNLDLCRLRLHSLAAAGRCGDAARMLLLGGGDQSNLVRVLPLVVTATGNTSSRGSVLFGTDMMETAPEVEETAAAAASSEPAENKGHKEHKKTLTRPPPPARLRPPPAARRPFRWRRRSTCRHSRTLRRR